MTGKRGRPKVRTKLTQQHTIKLGTMNIVKGANKKGEMTYTWDVVQQCRFDECPAKDRCHYVEALLPGDECKIMKKYMRSASLSLFQAQTEMSTAQRYQVGMHIIPLYKTLCKMKIEEVGIQNVTIATSRGTLQIHPIYKEMREIIKVIDQVWKSIGVKGASAGALDTGFSYKGADGAGKTENYYEKMEKSAFASQKNVHPIKKKG